MSVQIYHWRVTLFGNTVSYDPYYFRLGSEDENGDHRPLVKHVLGQWANALAQSSAEEKRLFFPYGIEDQHVECLAATTEGERVTLRSVWVGVDGWTLDLHDLSDFIQSAPEIYQESSENFGVYDRAELIKALAEATSMD